MTLQVMEYFIKVAECANFTKASKLLYVSQPTLSRQIAELESELGVQLLDRTKRTLNLTYAGEIFLKEASEIVTRCNELPNLLSRKANIGFSLSIGYHSALDNQVLHRTLAKCAKRYPGISFRMKRCDFSELSRGLEDGSFDIVFSTEICLEGIPNLIRKNVHPCTLQVAVSKEHPLAQRDCVRLGELQGENFILVERATSPISIDYVISLCISFGFSPRVSKRYMDGQTLMMMVGANEGISIVFSNIVCPDTVKLLDITEPATYFPFEAVYKSENKNPAIQLFMRVLDAVAKESKTE